MNILSDGVGLETGVLSTAEVDAARVAVDELIGEDFCDEPLIGRSQFTERVNGRVVRNHPVFAPMFARPEMLAIVEGVLGPDPLLLYTRVVATVEGSKADVPHSNHYGGGIVPEPAILSVCYYLDANDAASGQFTFEAGSHLKYYPPNLVVPTPDEIAAGTFLPIDAAPGDVLYRIPEVWHAVSEVYIPARRYVAAFWVSTKKASGDLAGRIDRALFYEENKPTGLSI